MYCYTIECYKGYYIDADNITGKNEYSIWFEGDDISFETLEQARAFIDKLVADRPQLREVI